ncbi:MAG: methionyl-tRNA formyltransferase [Bacilli bacterium]
MDLSKIEIEKEVQIIFMGTPVFAVPVLQGLLDNYKVRAVVTQPDKGAYSPIKKLALDNNILVLQPHKIKEEFKEIIDLEPSLIVTCAYGQIIPEEVLDCPRLGCVNVHASLLPKLRGGAPIHKAIIEGHKKTGITIMYMNPKMDEGDIISQEEVVIEDTDTASSLHDKLSIVGRDLLLKTLPSIIDGTNTRTAQNNQEATLAFTIKREDEKISFNKTVKQVVNQIRGLNGWPGAYCIFEGKILKVWSSYATDNYPTGFNGAITSLYKDGFGVKVSNGEVVFTCVQLEGKNKVSGIDFINGKENLVGKILQ